MPVRPTHPLAVTLHATRLRKGPGYPSPCINVCRMAEHNGLCEGCWRTMAEIGAWSQLPEAERATCWQRIEARQRAAGHHI